MVIDSGEGTRCRCKFKAPSLQRKSTKNEVPFENMGFNGNDFEDSDEKKLKYTSSLDQTTPWNTFPLNARIDDRPCNQQEKTWRKIEKKHSDQNSWKYARRELNSQGLTFSTLI